MDKVNKYQTLIILGAVLIGLIIGQNTLISDVSGHLIVPLLMFMLLGLFLSISLKELKSSFLNRKFSVTSVVINYIWTPVFAYALGSLFLRQYEAIWLGFVMLMVTPCTDWYLVFTGVAKGNVSLAASILPMNLILQVLLLPLYLLLFFGKSGRVELDFLLQSILLILVIPFAVAQIMHYLMQATSSTIVGKVGGFFKEYQILFLALAVVAMFATEGQSLVEHLNIIYILIVPVLLYFAATFVLGKFVSKRLKFSYEDTVSLHMTTLARNSPIALAIAVTAFSDEPLIALSLVIQPLLELPILVITAQVLVKTKPVTDRSV